MDENRQIDLTFITNEKNQKLLDRFKVLIKDTRLFDVLVGYFYTSGFHALYKSLESTEKIRILIGISTNKEVINLIQISKNETQPTLQFSHTEVKGEFENAVISEMEQCEDSAPVEEGIFKFIEWLKSGKLEIRKHIWPRTRVISVQQGGWSNYKGSAIELSCKHSSNVGLP